MGERGPGAKLQNQFFRRILPVSIGIKEIILGHHEAIQGLCHAPLDLFIFISVIEKSYKNHEFWALSDPKL